MREDLPLVLSSLENSNLGEAMSPDFSQVIEAVAKGDIKPLAEKARSAHKESKASTGVHASVGRGSTTQGSDPPSRVSPSDVFIK